MNNTINIEVSVSRTSKPYVGRITGKSATYGVALDFLPLARWSAKLHKATITEPGDYQVPSGNNGEAVCASRRRDTGYIRVAADGTVSDITKAEAIAALEGGAK